MSELEPVVNVFTLDVQRGSLTLVDEVATSLARLAAEGRTVLEVPL